MKLDTRAFSISVGVISALLYLLCALVVSAIPGFAAALGRHTLHVDMSEQISSITFL